MALKPETWDVIGDVLHERRVQNAKWGEQDHPDGTALGNYDKWSEVHAKEATNNAAADGRCTWRLILAEEVAEAFAESDPTLLREELIQVAAVASAWVEAIDRREANK